MNYWPRWINAIKKRTASLSLAQMGAYDRLLDHYYSEEHPLPPTLEECCRIVGAINKAERDAVAHVLDRFFVKTDAGYTNERADDEIKLALPKIAAAKANGAKGGRPSGTGKKPTGFPTGNPTGTQQEPSAKAPHPQSNSSDADASGGKPPVQSASAPPPPTARDVVFAIGVPLLTAANVSEANARRFLGMQLKGGDDGRVAAAVQACAAEQIVDPISWLQKRLGPIKTGTKAGKHAGFDQLDYHDGVTADGHLA